MWPTLLQGWYAHLNRDADQASATVHDSNELSSKAHADTRHFADNATIAADEVACDVEGNVRATPAGGVASYIVGLIGGIALRRERVCVHLWTVRELGFVAQVIDCAACMHLKAAAVFYRYTFEVPSFKT